MVLNRKPLEFKKNSKKNDIQKIKKDSIKLSKKSKVLKGKSLVGRTYKVNDNDLPHKNEGSGKIVDLAVIESNGKHIGGVRVTTKNGKNAFSFKTKHNLYKGYKTFLETKFSNNDDIVSDDKRLHENPWKYNLTVDNIKEVREKIYYHSRQANENREKRDKLKLRNKKSRH